MRTAFIEALCELAARDERVWLLTGDLGFSVLERFAERFPDRYVNVGVAEQNMTGIAAGLAMSGKTVFTYSIANFPTLRCLEQIRNDVCNHNANVKIVAVGGGLAYGPAGYTHHAVEDLAIMRALPNMVVVAPGDPVEARLATRAIAEHQGPCYLRLGKSHEPVVHKQPPSFSLGRAIRLRDGGDATLISTGGILPVAVEVVDLLARTGIQIRLLSMPTLVPFDVDAVEASARETGAVFTLEEHRLVGGLGSAVAETLAEMGSRAPLHRLAVRDENLHAVGSQDYLRQQSGLTASQIGETIGRMLRNRKNPSRS
ncbi:MAG: transketolase C-terminal domain-containing protein [Verrucomicrobiia bacterium]